MSDRTTCGAFDGPFFRDLVRPVKSRVDPLDTIEADMLKLIFEIRSTHDPKDLAVKQRALKALEDLMNENHGI